MTVDDADVVGELVVGGETVVLAVAFLDHKDRKNLKEAKQGSKLTRSAKIAQVNTMLRYRLLFILKHRPVTEELSSRTSVLNQVQTET